jgi:hypothetical protein
MGGYLTSRGRRSPMTECSGVRQYTPKTHLPPKTHLSPHRYEALLLLILFTDALCARRFRPTHPTSYLSLYQSYVDRARFTRSPGSAFVKYSRVRAGPAKASAFAVHLAEACHTRAGSACVVVYKTSPSPFPFPPPSSIQPPPAPPRCISVTYHLCATLPDRTSVWRSTGHATCVRQAA